MNNNSSNVKFTSEKPFDTVKDSHGRTLQLFHGKKPHGVIEKNTYAVTEDGEVWEFDGHRVPFKIEIEENNYMKSSGLSGDEIRKGGIVKVWADGVQVYEAGCRNYQRGYQLAQQFIDSMEEQWNWYPKDLGQWLGKTIGYREDICRIERFILDQGCMIISMRDGGVFPQQIWEDDEDFEGETELKVEVNCPHITWYLRDSLYIDKEERI